MNLEKRIFALLLATILLLSVTACGQKKADGTTSPIIEVIEPTVTEPSVTEAPETEPPVTEPAETEPAVTETTEPDTTEAEPVETEPAETEVLCEHKFYNNPKHYPPTCKAEGYTEYTCELCDEVVKDNFKPIASHLYVREVISYASCTTDGVEAMVCTYCGEKKSEAQAEEHIFQELTVVDDSYIYGKCSECGIERLIYEDYWLKSDATSYFSVGGDVTHSFEDDFKGSSNPYQMEFTLTFEGFGDASQADNKNLMRYNNYNNSILRQFTVDGETVEIKGNDDYKTHFVNLKVGESATFRFWVEPESDTIAIYVNGEYVMTRYDENFQFENEPALRWGHNGSFSYKVSNFSIIRPIVDREEVAGFVPAYGHSTVYNIFDVPTLTHHKVEVGECERCGQVFDAKGVKGEEHKFTLVKRVEDDKTVAGFNVYGYETLTCDCGYVLTVSSNHKDGHFYDVDIYTGKYKCRCGSVYVGEFDKAHNGNENAGVLASGKEETNE